MNAEVPPVFAGTAKPKKPTLVRSKEQGAIKKLTIIYYLLSINF